MRACLSTQMAGVRARSLMLAQAPDFMAGAEAPDSMADAGAGRPDIGKLPPHGRNTVDGE
jgi:hypothetical protein